MRQLTDFSKRDHVYYTYTLKTVLQQSLKSTYNIFGTIFFNLKAGSSVNNLKPVFKLFKTVSLMFKLFKGFLGGNVSNTICSKVIIVIELGHNSQLKKMELCRIFTKSTIKSIG